MSTIVAPNMLNSLEVVKPLRLMPSRRSAITVKQSFGIHRVQVPSNLGGTLVIGLGIDDLVPPPGTKDWRDGIDFKVMDPHGFIHAMKDPLQPLRLEIPAGRRGNGLFFVYMNAPSGKYQLYARFVDVGQARNPDGTPFIPWNFWFFPYSRTTEAGPDATAWASAQFRPLEKYEKAFGVTGAVEWERRFHSDLHKSRKHWAGHCDDAAPASVLFAPPPSEGLTHNGVHFSCEELKLLAAEVTAQHKISFAKWIMNKEVTTVGRFHERKPSDAPEEFGTAPEEGIAELLEALRQQFEGIGDALIMDLRDATGNEFDEVWNHAVFRYETSLWQSNVHEPDLVEGQTILYANADALDIDNMTCRGFPAEVHGTGRTATVSLTSDKTWRVLRYRIRYNRFGGIDRDSPDQLWRSVVSPSGEKVHVPRYAATFNGLPHDVRHAPRPDGGNPHVLREHILELLPLRRQP
ncbi:MAG: hypothetical protein AAF799_47225 [Myxococcota bacterium]